MQKPDKNTVIVIGAVVLVVAFWASHNPGVIPNPFVPAKPDRPVLKFIAKVAKTFLWVAVFAEPRPEAPPHHQAAIGVDGHERLDQREGW